MDTLKDAITKKIQEDGKIACADALEIAASLGVSAGAVGKEINAMKVKIKSCQLGCFG